VAGTVWEEWVVHWFAYGAGMKWIAHINLTLWHTRKAGDQMASDRVRGDEVAVKLFMAIKHIHRFASKSTTRTQSRLWNVISESLMPTGRVMR
jgi:hypothetical protein